MEKQIKNYVEKLINAERAQIRKIAPQMGLIEIDNPFIPGEKIYYRP